MVSLPSPDLQNLSLEHAEPKDVEIPPSLAGSTGKVIPLCFSDCFRCELFDQNLKLALEVAEKAGPFGPGS